MQDDGEETPGEFKRRVLAPAEAGGERVDAWLAKAWPDLSRARVQGLIGQGKLRADGEPITHASAKTKAGAHYELTLPPPEPARPEPENIPLDVVYEDTHLIVINKTAGMAVHPASGSLRGTLVNAVLAHCAGSLSGIGGVARPGIVHRIDKDTTGLIVVAKADATHNGLAKQFAKHTIERVYFAVTRGAPKERSGALETPLARSRDNRMKFVVVKEESANAKRAVTHYWTVESFGQATGRSAGRPAAALMECRLETGRTHQIRVHMAHLGAPLIGDPVYGKQRAFKAEGPHAAAAAAAVEAFPRQALHAAVLGFKHPITGEQLRFEAPLPDDMRSLIAILREL